MRITESAVALHGTIGPARTSMSAVAEHAGVRRSTLYRHFADETALFSACSALWMRDNPPPDLSTWAEEHDPEARLRLALSEIYAYYGRCERMLSNLIRDVETTPAMQHEFAQFARYFAAALDALSGAPRARGRPSARRRAAIGHALAFSTWRSLVRDQGLDEADAISLMRALIAAATQATPP